MRNPHCTPFIITHVPHHLALKLDFHAAFPFRSPFTLLPIIAPASFHLAIRFGATPILEIRIFQVQSIFLVIRVLGKILLRLFFTSNAVEAAVINRHRDCEDVFITVDVGELGFAGDAGAGVFIREGNVENLRLFKVNKTQRVLGLAGKEGLREDGELGERSGAEGAEVIGLGGAAAGGEWRDPGEDVLATSHFGGGRRCC